MRAASERAQDGTLGIEEEPARGDQRGARPWDLTVSGLTAELHHSFSYVAGSARGTFGEGSAVRVHGNAAVDEDAVVVGVPIVGEELRRTARRAVAHVLEPGERDDREAVIGQEDIDVVEPEVALGLERVDHDLLAVIVQVGDLILVCAAEPNGRG